MSIQCTQYSLSIGFAATIEKIIARGVSLDEMKMILLEYRVEPNVDTSQKSKVYTEQKLRNDFLYHVPIQQLLYLSRA